MPCKVTSNKTSSYHDSQCDYQTLNISIERPMRAITKGQTAVFYNGKECLGGANISEIGPSLNDIENGEELLKNNEHMAMVQRR